MSTGTSYTDEFNISVEVFDEFTRRVDPIIISPNMNRINIKSDCCSCLFSPNCYVVNASSFLGPLHFVKPVYGYVMPVLVLLTSLCNLIIILVLSRFKKKKTRKNLRILR